MIVWIILTIIFGVLFLITYYLGLSEPFWLSMLWHKKIYKIVIITCAISFILFILSMILHATIPIKI